MGSSTIIADGAKKNSKRAVAGKRTARNVSKNKISTVVFQVIKRCDQACPHCFFSSTPASIERLSYLQISKGINDLKNAGIVNVGVFVFTGGEPTLFDELKSMIENLRKIFPAAKVRIDTNGLNFYLNSNLFNFLNADIYDISVDEFHNLGTVVNLETKQLFVDANGRSKILDLFLENQSKYGFELNVRWTSNRSDKNIYDKFLKRYIAQKVTIAKKFVTATGRGKKLPSDVIGDGCKIEDNPRNFSCLMGDTLLLAIDGYWYGCYHPVSLTMLCKPGDVDFGKKLKDLVASKIYRNLPTCGILEVLRSKRKTATDEGKKVIDQIFNKKYWYRCEPCVEACDKGILTQK